MTILALDLGTKCGHAIGLSDGAVVSGVWEAVPGWPAYEVSEHGDVRRVTTSRRGKAGAILKPFLRENGYTQIHLHANGQRRRFLVHRLVALAFLGPQPSPRHEVAHLDGNRAHNHRSNLIWTEHRENEKHKQMHGTLLHGQRVGTARLNDERVRMIKRALSSGQSQSDIARLHKVSVSTIHLIAHGKSWARVQ